MTDKLEQSGRVKYRVKELSERGVWEVRNRNKLRKTEKVKVSQKRKAIRVGSREPETKSWREADRESYRYAMRKKEYIRTDD